MMKPTKCPCGADLLRGVEYFEEENDIVKIGYICSHNPEHIVYTEVNLNQFLRVWIYANIEIKIRSDG